VGRRRDVSSSANTFCSRAQNISACTSATRHLLCSMPSWLSQRHAYASVPALYPVPLSLYAGTITTPAFTTVSAALCAIRMLSLSFWLFIWLLLCGTFSSSAGARPWRDGAVSSAVASYYLPAAPRVWLWLAASWRKAAAAATAAFFSTSLCGWEALHALQGQTGTITCEDAWDGQGFLSLNSLAAERWL